uniref:Uncharacterized protein n=1 Tax=Trichinella nativa TaxID=6335 RepID=A0A0V1KIA1_9BILA
MHYHYKAKISFKPFTISATAVICVHWDLCTGTRDK